MIENSEKEKAWISSLPFLVCFSTPPAHQRKLFPRDVTTDGLICCLPVHCSMRWSVPRCILHKSLLLLWVWNTRTHTHTQREYVIWLCIQKWYTSQSLMCIHKTLTYYVAYVKLLTQREHTQVSSPLVSTMILKLEKSREKTLKTSLVCVYRMLEDCLSTQYRCSGIQWKHLSVLERNPGIGVFCSGTSNRLITMVSRHHGVKRQPGNQQAVL